MRELTDSPMGPELPLAPETAPREPRLAATLRETAVVLGVFAALGIIGALIWWQVVDLPHYTVGPGGAAMDEEQLSKQIGIDGWYAAIALVGGLLAGTVLALRFQRDLVLTIVLLLLGGALAAWIMRTAGLTLGPPVPETVFKGAKQGATIPVQLAITMPAVYLIWPIAALLGSVGVVWGTDPTPRPRHAAASATGELGDAAAGDAQHRGHIGHGEAGGS